VRRREFITLIGGASFFRSKIALAETSQKYGALACCSVSRKDRKQHHEYGHFG
jgi:hypothetical protein